MLLSQETETEQNIPKPAKGGKTGPWLNNPNNPAEEHWLVDCDEFIGSDNFIDHSNAYRRTEYWLKERLYFSTEFSRLIEYGSDYPEALMTIRPCNNTKVFRKRNKLTHYFSYRTLAFEYEQNRVERPEGKIAKEIIEPIYRRLFHLDPLDRPSHLVLSYDEDNDILAAVAKQEGNEDFYAKYCRAKGLGL